MIPKRVFLVAVTLLLVVAAAVRGNSQTTCPVPQSPRDINPKPFPGVYNGTPPSRPESEVTDIVGAATIRYKGQTLQRCDQHYHVPVENIQGCRGEKTVIPAPKNEEVPPEGQWVEVHTVYAAEVSSKPECADGLDHALECCTKPPFVVRGFNAKVAPDGGNVPSGTAIISPLGRPLAEWSGSNTGPDKVPGECKPIAAQWSNLLNCEITVTQSQLHVYSHPHGAREVQPENRLSKDLTLVGTPPGNGSCRQIKASSVIQNAAEAKTACPAVCVAPAKWDGQWVTTTAVSGTQSSACGCCVLLSKTPSPPEAQLPGK